MCGGDCATLCLQATSLFLDLQVPRAGTCGIFAHDARSVPPPSSSWPPARLRRLHLFKSGGPKHVTANVCALWRCVLASAGYNSNNSNSGQEQ